MRAGFHPPSHYSLWDQALDWLDIRCSALIMWAESRWFAVEFLSCLTHKIQLHLHVQHYLPWLSQYVFFYLWLVAGPVLSTTSSLNVLGWLIPRWLRDRHFMRINWQWITSESAFIEGLNQAIALLSWGWRPLQFFYKGSALLDATSRFLFSVESGGVGGCGKTMRVVPLWSTDHWCPALLWHLWH